MSDGPWRTLPMRLHWKQVAKQAEQQAFSESEICEAISAALYKEASDIPLESICRATVPNGQGLLIGPMLSGELEAIRRKHEGSNNTQTLLDIVHDAAMNRSLSKALLQTALSETLRECGQDHARAIVEHYYRKCAEPKINIDARIESALTSLDYQEIAIQLIESPGSLQRVPSMVRREGLDDGPNL